MRWRSIAAAVTSVTVIAYADDYATADDSLYILRGDGFASRHRW